MAGITLSQAEAKLALWLEADDALSKAQSYSIAGRSLTRTDARLVQEKIEFWDRQVKRLTTNTGGGIRVRGATIE
jgi:hypothetical protein